MPGAVHLNWYATGFRADRLEEALAELTPLSVRYGASAYSLYRNRDDRYKVQQIIHFDSKKEWETFWNGPEFTRFRTLTSGWWQVPILYVWHDVVAFGEGPKDPAELTGSGAPAPDPAPAEA